MADLLQAYQTEVENAVQYYKDLLLYQYSDKPKAQSHIELLARQGLSNLVLKQIRDGFNIETAVGDQLDVIGEYIGQSREVPIPIPRPYFEFDDYENPLLAPIGFTDYNDPNQNADSVFFKYIFLNTDTQTLNDEEYRTLLKLRAVLNTSNLSTAAIDEFLSLFFAGELSFTDNQNMTLTYFVAPEQSRLVQLALALDLLPKPACVNISAVINIPDPALIFSMAQYDGTISPQDGFNDYNQPANGLIFLSYNNFL